MRSIILFLLLAAEALAADDAARERLRFLDSSPHPVLVSITADSIVYSASRRWLYARGNVRYSGRGFVVAAELLRLDIGSGRAALSNAEGVLRRGKKRKSFKADVLHLDLTLRRAVGTTYGDRLEVERIWLPEEGEQNTTELDLYFEQLDNLSIDAELGPILEDRLYLEMEKAELDPESRLRAWGVVPYIEGEPGPRLPYFSFRTGQAQPRQGFSLKSFGASNVSGLRGEGTYAMSLAESLLTTFDLRYEELSFLEDPFRPKRRARLGLKQILFLKDWLQGDLGGFYQTDRQWEGGASLELDRGAHHASLQALFQKDTFSGRHNRLRLEHKFDREELESNFQADLDLDRQLDLRWRFMAKAWKDHLQLNGSASYLNRAGDFGAEILTQNAIGSLRLSPVLATLSYFGTQDLGRTARSHHPSLSLETLPFSVGAGLMASTGNQVQLSVDQTPLLEDSRLDDEAWLRLWHVPIQFTSSLTYDASLKLAQRTLQELPDETSLEGLLTLTRRFGTISSAALDYRYLTIRQSASDWFTVGTVLQELHASAQMFWKGGKRLLAEGRYSLTEGQAIDAYLFFEGDFGPAWKASLRSGFDFRRNTFNVLDTSISRDLFFGWMRVTYRKVQNELSIDYTAKLF